MSDNTPESSPDEQQQMLQKKKKRLYTPKTRAKCIITAGPSQDPQIPIAESELLDFRNRASPPVTREAVPVIPTAPLNVCSEYDASCDSLDLTASDYESRDNTESEATVTSGGIRCQEQITSDDPQEGLSPSVDAHISFDTGCLASSDFFSTSDIHDVVARYAHDPDVSQWARNNNPEIRIHCQIIYDQPLIHRLPVASRAADTLAVPPENITDAVFLLERTRLNYREVGVTSSGGSVIDSSVSTTKQEPTAVGSHSDVASNHNDVMYDEAFEEMLINRIQNRIRELGGVGGLELSDEAGLTPAGRQVKQRFGFLMRDVSDEEDGAEQTTGAASVTERGRRRRRRRHAPDWMLTDAPSDETLRTDLDAPLSTASLELDGGPSEPPPPRYSRSPDSESEVSALRAIRADGGDQFVEAVLWRLHENLRAGHNFREYRGSMVGKSTHTGRQFRHDTSSDEDSDAASSRSSTGRVQFKDRVLVRPLVRDPLLTEYRRPYSKVSKQKLSSLKEYKPEPEDPDYEDSLKDRTEPTAAKPPAKSTPTVDTPAAQLAKPQPGWKKLFCCVSGGNADDATPKPAAAAAVPPPPVTAAPPPPPPSAAAAPPSPELKRKRRRVKALAVQELDPDITNEELRSLHMMFDDRVELCSLSDQTTEASLDEPSELSDPESDVEPCFSDFLKACGLKEDKINEYMKFCKTHKGLTDSGHGDWTATRRSPDGRPASVSSTDDPSWWDKRARERRHQFRRHRREHREYQRQLETQRDLEVEGQLRRALETQRELLREREVERELERTRESSKERKELRLEEEVLEKELLRRLLAELQNEQVRSREREKRRTVARILEEELITRLTLALARQREKSEERHGQHETQRMEEEANTRELNNRIEELRMRIEENKILRDYERDEEQERLKLLEELLVKERRRMEVLETSRLQEQDQETKTRALLTELEEKSGEDEVKSQQNYEYCAKALLKKNDLHKAMRQKLTTEIRKRELVKRKLVSLSDIEKSNPRLFQLAKVMEEATDEKGCLQLEYTEPGSGILKKDTQIESEGARTDEVKTEGSEDEQITTEEGGNGQVKTEEGADYNKEAALVIEETAANIKQEPPDDNTETTAEAPVEAGGAGLVMVGTLETEVRKVETESSSNPVSSTEDTSGETDLELPRSDESPHSNEDTKPPVPQAEAVADSQPSDELSDGEAPPPSVKGTEEAREVEVKDEKVESEVEGVERAERVGEVEPKDVETEHVERVETDEVEQTAQVEETAEGKQHQQTKTPTNDAVTHDTAVELPKPPAEAAGPAEPATKETVRFKESGVQVNADRASPVPNTEATPAEPVYDAGPSQTDESGTDGELTAVVEPTHSDSQEDAVLSHMAELSERHSENDKVPEARPPEPAEPAAAEVEAAEARVEGEGAIATESADASTTGAGTEGERASASAAAGTTGAGTEGEGASASAAAGTTGAGTEGEGASASAAAGTTGTGTEGEGASASAAAGTTGAGTEGEGASASAAAGTIAAGTEGEGASASAADEVGLSETATEKAGAAETVTEEAEVTETRMKEADKTEAERNEENVITERTEQTGEAEIGAAQEAGVQEPVSEEPRTGEGGTAEGGEEEAGAIEAETTKTAADEGAT